MSATATERVVVDRSTVDLHYSAAAARLETTHPRLYETLSNSLEAREFFKKLVTHAAMHDLNGRSEGFYFVEEAAAAFTSSCMASCGALATTLESRLVPGPPRNDDACGVCLASSNTPCYTLSCGHTFHVDCISRWGTTMIGEGLTCPTCRREHWRGGVKRGEI